MQLQPSMAFLPAAVVKTIKVPETGNPFPVSAPCLQLFDTDFDSAILPYIVSPPLFPTRHNLKSKIAPLFLLMIDTSVTSLLHRDLTSSERQLH